MAAMRAAIAEGRFEAWRKAFAGAQRRRGAGAAAEGEDLGLDG